MGDLYFRFMVVEYCAGTLDDLVHGRCEGPADSLQQISSGLAFLHSLNIVHGNLKPSNILASFLTGNNPPKMKLADFGLCHINKNWNQTFFGNKEMAAYTSEWGPPESILSPAFDVYSLARVFCFVLLKDSYPTKISLIEFIALVTNARRLNPFIFRCSFHAMLQLIDTMLSFKAYRRPTATQVLQQIASRSAPIPSPEKSKKNKTAAAPPPESRQGKINNLISQSHLNFNIFILNFLHRVWTKRSNGRQSWWRRRLDCVTPTS